jgi:hypothetical protein
VSSAFCLVEEMNLTKMLGSSSVVVKGRVVATDSQWASDQRGNHIWTRVSVLVDNTLKGAVAGNWLILEVQGGTVGDITEAVSDMPAFAAGEEVVLFLAGNPLGVVGGYQGKLTVADGKVNADGVDVELGAFLRGVAAAVAKPGSELSFPENGVMVVGGGQVAAADTPAGTKAVELPQAKAGEEGQVPAADLPAPAKLGEPASVGAGPVAGESGPVLAGDVPKVKKETTGPPGPAILTATIYDAWWENAVDIDGDAYKRQARLVWDPNVAGGSGSLTVFERIYYKRSSSSAWTLFVTTNPHVITGTATTDAYAASVYSGTETNWWDWRIDVYRSGMTTPDSSRTCFTDADLNDCRLEHWGNDGGLRMIIYNAWWTAEVDYDGDGYKRSTRLNWDPDVSGSNSSFSVYERVYYKPASATAWALLATIPSHYITAQVPTDARYLNITWTGPRNLYDFRIDIYRSGYTAAQYSCQPPNDRSLDNYGLEPASLDVKAVIANAWWTNPVDMDGDGFKRSARLNWDSNILGTAAALSVYEKVYYKTWSVSTYTFLYQTPAHAIAGTSTADARYLDVVGSSNNYYDFKIEVYRSGVTPADDVRSESNDADLNNYKMETAAQDTLGTPAISSISPNKASAGTNTEVTITGSNFGPSPGAAGKVEFFYRSGLPKIAAPIVSWSSTQIRCKVPTAIVSGYPASAGSGPVTVKNSASLVSAGYMFRVTFGYGGVRWPSASPSNAMATVNFKVRENTTDCTGEGAAVQAAAITWTGAWAYLTFHYAGTHSSTTSGRNYSNEIMWGTASTTGILAMTTYWYSGSTLLECDIVFNDAYNWRTIPRVPAGCYDVQTIALHELGHWLNLRDLYGNVGDSIYDNAKVMYGFGSTGQSKRSLHTDDRDGIRWIYGAIPTIVDPGSDDIVNVSW